MAKQKFGLIGLGVMGQNFVLNVERNGFGVAVYNRSPEKTKEYINGPAAGKNIQPTYSLEEFVDALERPRRIMLLVKAGGPVDATIEQLVPLLDKDDLIIDGGNSFFFDTERRANNLQEKGIHFFGMGVSGGEEGALWGPSLMPGGSESAYKEVEPIMTAVSAKAEEDGAPCVAYLGPGGSGHYVKMVHNGIEYGDMQLISEAYDLLKRALAISAKQFHEIFSEWNQSELSSFLIEVTSKVFTKIDEETGKPLVDVILDKAGQKGTGKWTSQNALDLGAAIPTITAAVDGRFLSALKDERVDAAKILPGPKTEYSGDSKQLIDAVRDALYASKICSYAQGMKLLGAASDEYDYDLKLGEIARIWRAGCIIRARLLNDITEAYNRNRELPNLLVDEEFKNAIVSRQEAWRFTVRTAVDLGVPLPAISASLAYYDAYRSERLPANLVQAQRDFFGAHTFERLDKPGTFHAEWVSS
ncbi:NADP-dependent phosphogluconate dehydrogenase [candidate division KSB1 bacterium]|nr:NADP-dependent phosphogluconate dehydrogenase [candidate division KSB1 bacterium]NIR70674.1 NADP-dependent phosphogluconate dehydrogenase [candidate division KSB1 bacterium]NIS26026.1 NADP-dependent phosphogluconate dehydrogenase [candidate division KSB1 bacterium]NIT72850.1 NADP-dependent phosphogluconate dehydrogenase [candidate division KSB1 bacterium]NIU26691.1 NADP-dependent phosphogluconate dehydrogenase [candidate division KSB1 bacterium]